MACVDVVLDCVGAAYLQRNLVYLNVDGRLFIIGSITEFVAELNIAAMFEKRFSIQGKVTFSKRRNGLLKKAYDGCS
ncbi:hypothetical protein ERO13_D05G334900v2 [Gossypium hirsutum]|uniref:MADS-box domain-containing protein n=4 Tax=Gossypium TaxID=3633 RepID=A0A0D2TXM0_GOSRA|nr:hypothetical protein ES319_D05G363900v1 [Gossypium barbadense]KAG4149431.1 hypothetical protein ERO13_D05G334900v2 [Gossypium hirsutum]KJB61439.1 hypothetical protein B456_009G358500 [Gossypium raimondii]TYG71341.1 hypothetical protein ES288_D05G388900v1 [Gossypium darwinii]TYH74251.1 hypothetical protein ES332_D05G386600v1 [Gossypium tomentosum]